MSQPADSNGVVSWILGISGATAIGAFLWSIIKKLLSFVTRQELATIFETRDAAQTRAVAAQDNKFLEAFRELKSGFDRALDTLRADKLRVTEEQHAEMLRLHAENKHEAKNNFDRISNRLLLVERSAARLEGALNGLSKTSDREG